MNKAVLAALLIIALTDSSALTQTPGDVPSKQASIESVTSRVDRLFAQWDKPDSAGCALGVVKDGKIIYSHGYGMADLEHDIPI